TLSHVCVWMDRHSRGTKAAGETHFANGGSHDYAGGFRAHGCFLDLWFYPAPRLEQPQFHSLFCPRPYLFRNRCCRTLDVHSPEGSAPGELSQAPALPKPGDAAYHVRPAVSLLHRERISDFGI